MRKNNKPRECIICPAIWIDDGKNHSKEKELNIPENIKTGYIVYGLNLRDIFFRMYKNKEINHFNLNNKNRPKITEFREGYYTTHHRFIEKFIEN